MQKTAISWTTKTWNPTSGCSVLSDGCKHCYAATLSAKYGWTDKPWTLQNEVENVKLKPHKLHEPYLEKEPVRCFVNSMSDLFHRVIPDWYRAAVFCVMLDLPQHTFQVLTKRADETIDWHERFLKAVRSNEFREFRAQVKRKDVRAALDKAEQYASPWGVNIWQGVSVEDARVLHRIDSLRQSKAHVRFISAEPLLGAWGDDVDLSGIHWVIVGGESGKHMTPGHPRWMNMEHARQIKRLCVDQGVAFFYKQDSGHVTELRPYLVETDGSKWEWQQFPGDLRPPKPFGSTNVIDDVEGKSLEECLHRAQQFEQLAYGYLDNQPLWPWWSENVALAAAYWYEAAQKLRPQRPASMPRYAAYESGELPDYEWGSVPRQALVRVSPAPEPAPKSPEPTSKQSTSNIGFSKGYSGDLLPEAHEATLRKIKPGTKLYAREDIHDRGKVIVKAGTPCIVETRGKGGLNVKFEGYPHLMLCLWDMVTDIPPQPAPREEDCPFVIGDKVTVSGSDIIGEVVALGGPNRYEGKVCVTRPNPNGGVNMTHWIKVEKVKRVQPTHEDETTQWVKDVNAAARKLDETYLTNVGRARAHAVANGLPPEVGDQVITQHFMKEESDAFVNLASGGTHPTVESLLDTVKPRPTRVVNFHDVKAHWNKKTQQWDSEQYVYIGRANATYNLPRSIWANDFKITKDTDEARARALEGYRGYVQRQLAEQPELRQQLETLRGKTLVCWCSPKACHGDVLLELLGEASQPVEQESKQQPEAAAPAQLSLFDVETEKTLHKSPIFY